MDESTMTDEFFAAFGEEDGYQSAQDTEGAETTADETTETEHVTENDESQDESAAESGEGEEGEETPGEKDEPAGDDQQPETFVLKVNKEEKTVTREQMIAYAQMGVDYDRVKAAAEQAKSDNTALKEQLAGMQEGHDLLTELAKDAGITVADLLDKMRANRYRGQGLSEDAASERVAREKAEKELARIRGEAKPEKKETDADRATREVTEFRKAYPDVDMTQELMDGLMEDVQAGMTLTQAYQKYEGAQKDAEIQRLNAELAAERKNRENRSTTPGSQSDSGAKRVKTQFDEFFDAFN